MRVWVGSDGLWIRRWGYSEGMGQIWGIMGKVEDIVRYGLDLVDYGST